MITIAPLPYSLEALEPVIDAKTMEIHWGKHHQAYADKANKLIDDSNDDWLKQAGLIEILKSKDKVSDSIRQGIINNVGGVVNHNLFWESLVPTSSYIAPSEVFSNILNSSMGDFDTFKKKMVEAGLARFGSGWVWLVVGSDGKLEICSTANQDNPWMDNKVPLLGIDVWEHAYYLKYQNKRADYLEAIWQVINWKVVEERFNKSLG